jgi:hypothetical protein
MCIYVRPLTVTPQHPPEQEEKAKAVKAAEARLAAAEQERGAAQAAVAAAEAKEGVRCLSFFCVVLYVGGGTAVRAFPLARLLALGLLLVDRSSQTYMMKQRRS